MLSMFEVLLTGSYLAQSHPLTTHYEVDDVDHLLCLEQEEVIERNAHIFPVYGQIYQ